MDWLDKVKWAENGLVPAIAQDACGFVRAALTPSPITGATGNQEFFLHLTHGRV